MYFPPPFKAQKKQSMEDLAKKDLYNYPLYVVYTIIVIVLTLAANSSAGTGPSLKYLHQRINTTD